MGVKRNGGAAAGENGVVEEGMKFGKAQTGKKPGQCQLQSLLDQKQAEEPISSPVLSCLFAPRVVVDLVDEEKEGGKGLRNRGGL